MSGAIDVIVVEDKEGNRHCTSFHFRLGKFRVFKPDKKDVELYINDQPFPVNMKLNKHGIGYFEVNEEEELGYGSHVFYEKEKIFDAKLISSVYKEDKEGELEKYASYEGEGKYSETIEKEYQSYNSNNDLVSEDIEFSLCADYVIKGMKRYEVNKIFSKYKVDEKSFKKGNPYWLLLDKKLLIKLDGKVYKSRRKNEKIKQRLFFDIKKQKFVLKNKKNDDYEKLKQYDVPNPKKKAFKPPKKALQGIVLNSGKNRLNYVIRNSKGKEKILETRLFFYKYNPDYRIVISDIDGTITKSDVMGHIMPIFNQDWSHNGIVELYNNLHSSGCIIIYLTARNIGLSRKTLKFLKSVEQKNCKLPEGPLICSPVTMFESFTSEVIKKNSEKYKIHVLKKIKKIFDFVNGNPMYAGFGNKPGDAVSYAKVHIHESRIFTIKSSGKISVCDEKDKYTYHKINQQFSTFFPDLSLNNSKTFSSSSSDESEEENTDPKDLLY